MLAAVFLAACLVPPLFDMTGPVCSPAAQTEECRCSECFSWDPVPGAEWYDVKRVDQDGTVHIVIGSTPIYPAYIDDDGISHPATTQTWWCFAKDASTPIEGRRYIYTIRACNAQGCSVWSTESVAYTGAPYWCFEGLGRITCPTIQ